MDEIGRAELKAAKKMANQRQEVVERLRVEIKGLRDELERAAPDAPRGGENYRRRPVFVDAFQLTEKHDKSLDDWPQWALKAVTDWDGKLGRVGNTLYLEKEYSLDSFSVGEWLVRDMSGNLSIIKGDEFSTFYEAVKVEA